MVLRLLGPTLSVWKRFLRHRIEGTHDLGPEALEARDCLPPSGRKSHLATVDLGHNGGGRSTLALFVADHGVAPQTGLVQLIENARLPRDRLAQVRRSLISGRTTLLIPQETLFMNQLGVRLVDGQLTREKEYWLHKLSGELIVARIPLDFIRLSSSQQEFEVVVLPIAEVTGSRLLKVGRDKETLVLMILVTALKVCLYRYTGVEDIVVGTAVHEKYRDVASLNTVLALRTRI